MLVLDRYNDPKFLQGQSLFRTRSVPALFNQGLSDLHPKKVTVLKVTGVELVTLSYF